MASSAPKSPDTGPTDSGMDDDPSDEDESNNEEEDPQDPEADIRKRRRQARRMDKYRRREQKYGLRIIAYVNTKSGGKAGKEVLRILRKRIPPTQVHDLFEPFQGVPHTLPLHVIDLENEQFEDASSVKTIRVLACGGDGTVGWVASSMEKLDLPYMPEMACLPLGTGNDLAKVLRWGRYFDTVQNFHPEHFVKKVFTARGKALDRWKMRIITADVLNRGNLPMTLPPQLRKTTSVAYDDGYGEVDAELLKLKLDRRRSLYMRHVQAAQKVAAQWFADRQMYRNLQGMHNMDYETWRKNFHDTKNIGLFTAGVKPAPPPNAAHVLPCVPGTADVTQAVHRARRLRKASLGGEAPGVIVGGHIGGVPAAINTRDGQVARRVSVDQILLLRERKPGQPRAAATAGGGGGGDAAPPALPAPPSSGAVGVAGVVDAGGGSGSEDVIRSTTAFPATADAGPGAAAPPRCSTIRRTKPPPDSEAGGPGIRRTKPEPDPTDAAALGVQSAHLPGGIARVGSINRTKPAAAAALEEFPDTTDDDAEADTAVDTEVAAEAEEEAEEAKHGARGGGGGRGGEGEESKTSYDNVLVVGTAAGGASLGDRPIKKTKPAGRVSFTFASERWEFSGAGIGVDDHEYDIYRATAGSDDGAAGGAAEGGAVAKGGDAPAAATAATTPLARVRLQCRSGTDDDGSGGDGGGGGGGGGGGAKDDDSPLSRSPGPLTTRQLSASRFRPWKTGTLLNYFHVGLGARLVYEFESERRAAPAHFKSREANNCMYASKWMRACCFSVKETLECRQCRKRADEDARRRNRLHRGPADAEGPAAAAAAAKPEMEQTEAGFVDTVNSKISLKIRPPPPPGSPPGTRMPFEVLDLRAYQLAEIAFVNIGSFGGGRVRTDQSHYNHAFKRQGGVPVRLGDGVIEIIGFRSLTHICLAMGCNLDVVVLGQATEILMYVHDNDELYMGVDGEPFKASGADEKGIDFAIQFAPDLKIPMLRPT